MNSCLSCNTPCQDSLCASCLSDRQNYPSIYRDLKAEIYHLDDLLRERQKVSEEFRRVRGKMLPADKQAVLAEIADELIPKLRDWYERREEKRAKLWKAWRTPFLGDD